jgi:hypothetical protein
MPDLHLTDEQLTQFRDGVLWNPVVASHLRTCPVCQNRLREARLLRVLLARPEQKKSPHPTPEDLAYYLEGRPPGMALTEIETHVAGCPQCFADLTAIREQFQPVSTPEEGPPEWVVVRAARDFQPPETRLNLGTLVVEWLNRIGPLLRLIPPSGQRVLGELGFVSDMVFEEQSEEGVRGLVAIPSPLSKMSFRADRIGRNFVRAEAHGEEEFEEAYEEVPEEVEPVDITIGHLKVRIIPQSRTQQQMALALTVTRSADNTPVSGVQLSLETPQQPTANATTSNEGKAEFPLPQGQAKLVFQSPVRAELQISF